MVKYLIFDTETDGLNIITSKPFLFQYGLVDEKLNLLGIQSFYKEDVASRNQFINYLRQAVTLVGHNIKFDVHMCINNGIDINIFESKNYIDTAVLARLVIDHDKQSDKAFSTALKKLAVRFLGIDSSDEERKLKAELSNLTIQHKQGLKDYLVANNVWVPGITQREDTKVLNDIYNNWHKVFHKYPTIKPHRQMYFTKFPAPTYRDCSNVVVYGEGDIKHTHGLFKLWYPRVVSLKQSDTLVRISRATFPLILMERKGLTVDVPRLLNDRDMLLQEYSKTKIIDPRTGAQLSIGQHAKLKELYEYESGMSLASADKEARSQVAMFSAAANAADYISKMDKYISTYIAGIINKLTLVNGEYKVFTQYNLAGTVTGRLSSDFQQFPKEPLELSNGHKVDIRAWFIVPKQNKYMFYMDYSQLELRLQCEWTNIVNGQPDINLVRAFNPYRTIIGMDGKHYLEEDPTIEWKPTDLHGLTAKTAFPGIDENHPEWKHYRQLGKRANFACNYGASAPKIQESLHVDFKTAQALVAGYKKTFKGVVDFGNWLNRQTHITDNIPNLFLRRYYSRNKHQLNNWLVQGSGADLLLLKLREVYEYIKTRPHWNFMITVHDEIGYTCDDIPEQQLQKEIKDIQSIMGYSFSAVDIVADVEVTQTCWSDKDDWQ